MNGINKIQVRLDTPYCEELTHFNNAGASLPPKIVNESIVNFLHEEAQIGGYEIVLKYQDEIKQTYVEAAKLIKATPDEIALTDCASTAFSKAIFSIPFKKDDVILTSELEYSNNFLNYLKLKKDRGIKIVTIPPVENSAVDLTKLRNAITSKVKLISITHMPTSCGAITPVKEIGTIAKEHDILYMIDSCQSVGQYPIFVDDVQCDFLNATSRKYIRGPRGLGFLYVNKNIVDQLEPLAFESVGAEWESKDAYQLNNNISMFETYEKPYAFVIGFKEALKYANNIGIENIWSEISKLGTYLRNKLSEIDGVTVHDWTKNKSGIIAFTKQNIDPFILHQNLQDQKINSSVLHRFTSVLDMNNMGIVNGNRLSVHYYNTKEEVDKVVDAIKRI